MSREDKNRIGFTIALVSEFANKYAIHPRQAYAYLKRFKGLTFLSEHYGVLHTQSFAENVDVMAQVCMQNGGKLQ